MPSAQPANHSLTPGNASFSVGPLAIRPETPVVDRLVQSRLGVCTGLYFALRAKHPPSAVHSLRVALGCSKWATSLQVSERDRDLLEVAALLHEIGKLGVPDRVLQKPGHLNDQELLAMEVQSVVASEILRGSGATDELIEIIQQANQNSNPSQMSVTARMLVIADSFDSMLNQQSSIGRERAIEELFAHVGTQFDAALVESFVSFITKPRPDVEAVLATRWLKDLERTATPGFWESGTASSQCDRLSVEFLFHHQLLDTLSEAAVYLNSKGQVTGWNPAAERLTGREASNLLGKPWSADLMGLKNGTGGPLVSSDCPLTKSLQTQSASSNTLRVTHTDGRDVVVDFTSVPVFAGKEQFVGAILIANDLSAQTTLEQKVQSLREIACIDPLTKVANRAELSRSLPRFLAEHIAAGRRGSLIMCDIDYFKRINDQHGHQAGDEALVTFAALLRAEARTEDLVARYGGEEFIVLCAGCDDAAARSRAEEMRRAVETTPIPSLDRKTMTASFGVTEIQPGDRPETLLERADRALIMAKEGGRNRVVQVGSVHTSERTHNEGITNTDVVKPSTWTDWLLGSSQAILTNEYLASVPKAVAIQKLEGFIRDYHGELTKVEESRIVVRVDGQKQDVVRRTGERAAVLLLEIEFLDVQICTGDRQKSYQTRTKFVATVRSVRARDRRSESIRGQAFQLLQSFQAYLVAQEIDDSLRTRIILPR